MKVKYNMLASVCHYNTCTSSSQQKMICCCLFGVQFPGYWFLLPGKLSLSVCFPVWWLLMDSRGLDGWFSTDLLWNWMNITSRWCFLMPSLFSSANCLAHVQGDHGLWEQKAWQPSSQQASQSTPPFHSVISKEEGGKVSNCLYLQRSSKSLLLSLSATLWHHDCEGTHICKVDFTLLVIYTHFFLASSNWISLGLI